MAVEESEASPYAEYENDEVDGEGGARRLAEEDTTDGAVGSSDQLRPLFPLVESFSPPPCEIRRCSILEGRSTQ